MAPHFSLQVLRSRPFYLGMNNATLKPTDAPSKLPSVMSSANCAEADLRVRMALNDFELPPQSRIPSDLLDLIKGE